jgi:hypothetical protein
MNNARNRRHRLLLFAAGWTMITTIATAIDAPASDAQEPPKPAPTAPAPDFTGVLFEKDVPYLTPGREERLDLYLPADRPA